MYFMQMYEIYIIIIIMEKRLSANYLNPTMNGDRAQLSTLLHSRSLKKHRPFLQQEGLHLLIEDKWQLKEKEN